MKQYSLILLMLFLLTVNAVAGFTAPHLMGHGTETATVESHSESSHHTKTNENTSTEGHGCHDDAECHETEDCCVKHCQIAHAIIQERTLDDCSTLQIFEVAYTSISSLSSHSIPYFPD